MARSSSWLNAPHTKTRMPCAAACSLGSPGAPSRTLGMYTAFLEMSFFFENINNISKGHRWVTTTIWACAAACSLVATLVPSHTLGLLLLPFFEAGPNSHTHAAHVEFTSTWTSKWTKITLGQYDSPKNISIESTQAASGCGAWLSSDFEGKACPSPDRPRQHNDFFNLSYSTDHPPCVPHEDSVHAVHGNRSELRITECKERLQAVVTGDDDLLLALKNSDGHSISSGQPDGWICVSIPVNNALDIKEHPGSPSWKQKNIQVSGTPAKHRVDLLPRRDFH